VAAVLPEDVDFVQMSTACDGTPLVEDSEEVLVLL